MNQYMISYVDTLEKLNEAKIERIAELERQNAALKKQANGEFDAVITRNMELERENAELRADKERLDWLEVARPIAWALGSVNCGEYWLLTDIGEKHPEEAVEFATLRAAIDAARKESQP